MIASYLKIATNRRAIKSSAALAATMSNENDSQDQDNQDQDNQDQDSLK